MADASPGIVEATTLAAAKLGSGLAGSLLALRWIPKESGWLDRLTAFVGGLSAAMFVGPAIAEISNASATIEYAIVFVVGLFGMAAVGQLMETIKEIGLPAIARDFIRKFLRIGG